MELRQLRLFVTAAEQLNIGRAARTIGISQPSLSTALYRLEEELGVSLFERHRGGVRLTAAGAHLLQHAHRIIAEADETVRAARQWGAAEAGILDLGFFTSLASGPLRTLLEQYRAAFPQVDVRLHEADSAQQLSWLRERRLDLAIIADLPQNRLPELLPWNWKPA